MLSDAFVGIYKQKTDASVAQLTSVHLVAKGTSLTWPLAKSKYEVAWHRHLCARRPVAVVLTPLGSAPISGLSSSSSELPTDAEEIIRKVTTMDISEIMLTQYQIQSMLIM